MLGRKLAEGFIPAWAAGPPGETQESIDWMNNTPKVVFSNSLAESPWENAVVAGGDLAETINELKDQPGGDMIAYGGSTLVSSLIAKDLLDELHLSSTRPRSAPACRCSPTAANSGSGSSPRAVRVRDHRAATTNPRRS